ncbi:MAG: F0F1 ATP synthase subunit delta [Clostridiaceae bacterium]|nr:F0F1 ATP synthase subunit delta [Clostridiaceae bacterium]
MAELVAKRYAGALFDVAMEENKLQPIKEEMEFIETCLKENQDFAKLLNTPLIGSNEKKGVIKNVFENQLSNEVLNFLHILVDKGRTPYMHEIIKEFKKIADASKNMVEAIAITAIPLEKETLLKLQVQLSMASGKNVQLKNEVDKTVIGGIFVQMGDKVIDGTLRNRLGHLKQQLSQIIL